MPCMAQFLREFFHALHGRSHLVRHFYPIQHGRRYLLEPSWVESLGFSFPDTSLGPLFCSSCQTNSRKPDSFKNVLKECNPVVLVLILMLVSVGPASAGARGSKKNLFYYLSYFLFVIYKTLRKIMGKWWCSKIFCSKISFQLQPWYVSTYAQKTSGNKNPFPSHTETEFCFRDTKTEFRFHSTQNKILFPLHSKWISVSTPLEKKSVSGLHYSINPNTLSVFLGDF